jgi:hypothetical protein
LQNCLLCSKAAKTTLHFPLFSLFFFSPQKGRFTSSKMTFLSLHVSHALK